MCEKYLVTLRSGNKATGTNNQFSIHLPEIVDPKNQKYNVSLRQTYIQKPTSAAYHANSDIVEIRVRFHGYLYGYDSDRNVPMALGSIYVNGETTGVLTVETTENKQTIINPNNSMVDVQLWDVEKGELLEDSAGNELTGVALVLQFEPIKE